MALDERYDPTKNSFFAEILIKEGYPTTGVNPVSLTRRDNDLEAGVIFPKDKGSFIDIILVLHPNVGTGVTEHRKEIEEKVTYLGPIVRGTSGSVLAYKFQNDAGFVRDTAKDVVRQFCLGEEFETISPGKPGRFHGYHNLDTANPVALRIIKRFS
ncbi:hypothetical protein HYV50_02300 [Candidatus Pacearchaeota archaeon]|nr:hypothetical protein [Candidatus Pacearchaeota archaeon]